MGLDTRGLPVYHIILINQKNHNNKEKGNAGEREERSRRVLRGQMVLPKEVRDAAGIRPGDKLALVMWKKGAEVCCVSLIKVEALTRMVKGVLGPLMKELV